MRAPPEYNCLEVFAQCDGIRLLEHHEVFIKPTHRSPGTYTSYLEIPIHARVSFVVRCPGNEGYQGDLMSDPEIDGRPLCTAFLKGGSRQTVEHTTFVETNGDTGDRVGHDMILSKEVERGEEREDLLLDGCAKDVVGEIKVDIWRGTLYGAVDLLDNQQTDTGFDCDPILTYYNGLISLPSTGKRSVSSMAAQQVDCAESRFDSIEGADPWVRFVFKYASREALVALGVISPLALPFLLHTKDEGTNTTSEHSTAPSEALVLVPASPEQAVLASSPVDTHSGLSVTTCMPDIAGSELACPVASSNDLDGNESRIRDSAADYASLLDVCLRNQVQADLHDPTYVPPNLLTSPILADTSSKQSEQPIYEEEEEEDYQALYEALLLIPPEDLRTLDAVLENSATVSDTTNSVDSQPQAAQTKPSAIIIKDKHRRTNPAYPHARPTDLPTSQSAVPTSELSLYRPTESQTRSTTTFLQSGDIDINHRKRKGLSLDQDMNNILRHRSSEEAIRAQYKSMRSRQSGTTAIYIDKQRRTGTRTKESVEPLFFAEELWSSDDDSRHAYTVKSRTTKVGLSETGHSHNHSLRVGFDDTTATKSRSASRGHDASNAGGSSSRERVAVKAGSSSRRQIRSPHPPHRFSHSCSGRAHDHLPASQWRSSTAFPARRTIHPKRKTH